MKWKVLHLAVLMISVAAAAHAQTADRFGAYEHCRFADDLALVESTSLAGGVQGRTVKTVMGPRQVPLTAGKTLVYGYPQNEPFATVKVEQIPSADYKQARQDLVANFEQILTADDSSTRNYGLKPRLNGLEIYGLDRKQLEGGVLGIYLFFVDRTHTATTIYFLNQDPSVRSFQTLSDYAGLRDTFLNAYTSCAAGLPHGRTSPAHEIVAPPAEPAPAAPNPPLPEAPTAPNPLLPESPAAPSPAAPSPAAPPPVVPKANQSTSTVKTAAPPAVHPAAKAAVHRTTAASARKATKPVPHRSARESRTSKTSAGKTIKPTAHKKKPTR